MNWPLIKSASVNRCTDACARWVAPTGLLANEYRPGRARPARATVGMPRLGGRPATQGCPIPNLALSTGDRMIFCTVRLPKVVCKRSTLLPTESVAGESGLAVVGGIDAG